METLFWSHTLADIRTGIKLKVGYQTVKMTQDYLSLLKAAGAIFGDGEKSKAPKAKIPEDEDEAMRLAAAVFG